MTVPGAGLKRPAEPGADMGGRIDAGLVDPRSSDEGVVSRRREREIVILDGSAGCRLQRNRGRVSAETDIRLRFPSDSYG